MTGAIFMETLRQQLRGALYWGVGLGILGWFILAFVSDVDMLRQYSELMETMPPVLLQAFGVSDIATLATPEGFVSFGFFTYAILLMAVYAVAGGLSITANDEDDGRMDALLALPVARWQVVVERFGAYVVFVGILCLMSLAGLYIGTFFTPLEINLQPLAEGCLNMFLPTLTMVAGTMLLSVLLRRKSQATTSATSLIVGMYFVFFLGNSASDTILADMSVFSIFYYYNAEGVARDGLQIGHMLTLLITTVVILGVTLWLWERRDVGV